MLPHAQFSQLVAHALSSLPAYFQEKMHNVAVLVRTWPTQDDLRRAGVPTGHTLLGLYSGIPLTKRTSSYNLAPPDTITLFQGPLEMAAGGDLERLRAQVQHTIIHEFAHHFGISDERLRELGAY